MSSAQESNDNTSISYEEQLRRQIILNSIENKDYLLVIASQQQKSVQQVKHELMLKLTEG
ncbi:unnamed protein product [Debaryomyces tyrocola]|nr:unnamed protein product [Debaryomyces tyrocola]